MYVRNYFRHYGTAGVDEQHGELRTVEAGDLGKEGGGVGGGGDVDWEVCEG